MNRAGTEYTCIHNLGFFDGTGTNFAAEDAEIASMADWGINSEMITLNEDCWLGVNGVPAAYSDPNGPPSPGCSAVQCPYANAIENLVKTDEAHGIYPVISLFALASGGYAVEAVGAGGVHHLVGVQLGLFDDAEGLVQVTGTSLTPGTHVVVPSE